MAIGVPEGPSSGPGAAADAPDGITAGAGSVPSMTGEPETAAEFCSRFAWRQASAVAAVWLREKQKLHFTSYDERKMPGATGPLCWEAGAWDGPGEAKRTPPEAEPALAPGV